MLTYERRRTPTPLTLALTVAAVIVGVLTFGTRRGAGEQAQAAEIRFASDTGIDLNASYSDANILGLLDEVNKADSLAGVYAAARATSPLVRAFAQRMMSDHHELRKDLRATALGLNIKPDLPGKDPLKPAADTEMATLRNAAPGPIFDKAYIDQEIQLHKTVIDLAKGMLAQTKKQEIKDLIDRATPILTSHLAQAQAIQPKIGAKT
jgi:putative membrane protein